MIHPVELRAGNYIHPAMENGSMLEANTNKYLRVLSIDLETKIIKAKQDYQAEVFTFNAADIFPCSFKDIMLQIGGMSFGEHAIIIKSEREIILMLAGGTSVEMPHIQYLHQFQNLVRSLTGQEMAFNVEVTNSKKVQ